MKLSLPFLSKKEKLSYFLVLVFRNSKASAVIFEETQGNVQVVSKHSEDFKDSIETAGEEELLTVVDKTISKAESVLPDNIETQKTIFGLKENWIEDSKIKKEYLGKLKKISDELGLIPIGFIITTEAIANFLAKEEGAPVSAIIVELDKDFASVSLVRAGKIIETKNANVVGSVAETVDNLLKHFENVEVLPSRVIIFNGDKDLSQNFISHQWSKTLPFLHLPQITNLEPGFDAKAVLSGAASEMGFQILGEPSTPDRKRPTRTIANQEEIDRQEQISEEETIVSDETESKKNVPTEVLDDASVDFFGFVKDKDIAEEIAPTKTNAQEIPSDVMAEEIEEIPEQLQVETSESKSFPQNAFLILNGIKKITTSLLKNAKPFLSKIKLPLNMSNIKGNKIIFAPIAIAVIIIFLTFFYFLGRSATIILTLDGKKISQSRDVTFSASSKSDVSKNIIAAQYVDVTESGSVSTSATGNKDIGTPAKGTVTLFNNGDGSITFQSGTTITSSNSLKFTLDKDILVASPSGDASNPKPGTASVAVTASEIGTQYNIPSNTKFTVGNSSIALYAAKNDNAFSGGTKKNITVVSKDDITKLQDTLIKNLEGKAKSDIMGKISGEKILLPVFVSETLSDKNFDKNVGDEASNVTLKGTVDYKSITYGKRDIVSFAKDALKNDVSNNLLIDENNILADVKNIKTENNNDVSTTLSISAFLLPKIDQATLAKQISGKSIAQAQDLLLNISQVSEAIIKISPNIPLFPKNIPGPSKIKFTINLNE